MKQNILQLICGLVLALLNEHLAFEYLMHFEAAHLPVSWVVCRQCMEGGSFTGAASITLWPMVEHLKSSTHGNAAKHKYIESMVVKHYHDQNRCAFI